MTTLSVTHFDVLEFVKKSKELGVSEPVAEYQARQFEQVIGIAVATVREEILTKELASKGDLRETELRLLKEIEIVRKEIEIIRKEMEQLKFSLVKWVIGVGISAIVIISGTMFTMLKLMLT